MKDKEIKINSCWYLIIIDDAPKFLPGKSFIDILQLLFSTGKFNFVITDAIDGSGEDWIITNLQAKRNDVFTFKKILRILSKINQLDWGDFFLFENYPENWTNNFNEKYSMIVSQTETTIRAVDNQYLYIYTPFQDIVELLKNTYSIEEIKSGSLDDLDFPE